MDDPDRGWIKKISSNEYKAYCRVCMREILVGG